MTVLACAVPSVARAGAWSPNKGEGFAKLGLRWLPGTGYHDGQGRTIDVGAHHELRLDAYAEVGLGERTAFVVNTDLLRVFALSDDGSGESRTRVSFGDPTLGLRYQFLHAGRWAGALEMLVSVPLADTSATSCVGASKAVTLCRGRSQQDFV